jgi:hypothetical protein
MVFRVGTSPLKDDLVPNYPGGVYIFAQNNGVLVWNISPFWGITFFLSHSLTASQQTSRFNFFFTQDARQTWV